MPHPKPTALIICCCHSIYYPQPNPQNPSNPTPGTYPSDWLLAPFQKDEQITFLEHARKSIELLASTTDSLLVFSGGFTDPRVQVSEAASYLRLCEDNEFWGMRNEGELGGCDEEREESEKDGGSKGLRERIIVEEKALDSLQNLLFAILAFWKREGQWPERISIVSMSFKERRFMDLHMPTLRFPPFRTKFIGISPGYMSPHHPTFDEERTKSVIEGERTRGYEIWKADMLGNGEVLRGKRIGRDYWVTRGVWFENKERVRAGVTSEVLIFEGVEEEVLVEGAQPWGLGRKREEGK